MESEIRVVQNAINLKVSKGDVSSQINIEANRTLISSGKLILDANTYIMGTTFANDVKAKLLDAVYADIGNLRTNIITADVVTSTHLKVDSALITKLKVNNLLANSLISDTIITDAMKANALTAITANITSIRSQVLVSNVVEATHLKADTAMIDKLFATTALIDTLTSKAAFINSVKAIDISADRITAGTLNAANVNIINLNVSKIVGLNSSFVQSAWNGLNSTVSLDSSGLKSYYGRLESRFSSGAIKFYVGNIERGSLLPLDGRDDSTRTSIGLIGEAGNDVIIGASRDKGIYASIEVDGTTGKIGIRNTLDFSMGGSDIGRIYGHQTEGLIISSAGSEIQFYQGGKSLMYGVAGGLRMYRLINMNNNPIENVSSIKSTSITSTFAYVDVLTTDIIQSSNILTIKRGNDIYAQMVAGGFRMQSNINMNTFNLENVGKLTYSSDARYKSNIKNRIVSDLNIIRNIRYVNYTFNSTGTKQRGLIAQELNEVDPSLITTSSDGYLSYDSQQYVHTIGHALQELDVNVRKLRGNALANNNILLNKIGELERRSSMQNVTITRIDTFVTQHELEIKNLKKRIKELEEKVA